MKSALSVSDKFEVKETPSEMGSGDCIMVMQESDCFSQIKSIPKVTPEKPKF